MKFFKRTDAYVGTFDVESVDDMIEIEKIRRVVRNLNKTLKESGAVDSYGVPIRYRLCLKGRKPRIPMYNKKTRRMVKYTAFGDIPGGIANAQSIDAYLHRRY